MTWTHHVSQTPIVSHMQPTVYWTNEIFSSFFQLPCVFSLNYVSDSKTIYLPCLRTILNVTSDHRLNSYSVICESSLFATRSVQRVFEWRLLTALLMDDNWLVWFLKKCQSSLSCHLPPDKIRATPILWKAWLFLSKQIIPCWDVLLRHKPCSNF